MNQFKNRGVSPAGRRIIIIGLALAMAGCATLSEQECRYADWYELGERDARQGHGDDRLARHAESCEQYGIRPDARRWRDGWARGITFFCVPERGWREGRDGRRYDHVCPAGLEADFLVGYELGRMYYQTRQSMESVDRRIHVLEEQLADDHPDEDQRRDILRELRNLQRDARALERELALIESEAAGYGFR